MAKKLQSFFGQYSEIVVNTDIKENQTCDVFWTIQQHRGTPGLSDNITDASNQTRFGGTHAPYMFKWNWIVPAGVSNATFHIWGGGGSGAPGYCCSSGVGGGSGAYAYKTVSVTPGECYTACYEGAERYCCTTLSHMGDTSTDNTRPHVLHGLRGMKAYVNGTGLTNFCAEGGNPGVQRCGWVWGQDPQQDPSGNQFPGNAQLCQLWKMCQVVGRRTIDSDNDIYAPAKYYGADGGAKGMYACHYTNCCNSNDIAANRCGDKYIIPYPGGLTPNTWAPFGDMELASVNGGVYTSVQCNIVAPAHGSYLDDDLSAGLGYMCAANRASKIGVGGTSSTVCGGTCCCGSPGGVPLLRIEYS